VSWARRIAIGLLALLAAVCAILAWLVTTRSGAAWALSLAEERAGIIAVGHLDGSFAHGLALRDIEIDLGAGGPSIAIEALRVELRLAFLLRGAVDVERMEIDGATVRTPDPDASPSTEDADETESGEGMPEAPVGIVVRQLVARDLVILRRAGGPVRITSLRTSGSWLGRELAVHTLELQSPDGRLRLDAVAAGEDRLHLAGSATFEWAVDATTYAGELDIETVESRIEGRARLTSPLEATLAGALDQREDTPWSLDMDVPAFDVQPALGIELPVERMGARLCVHGTDATASATGTVVVDDTIAHVQALDVAAADATVRIERLLVALATRDEAEGSGALAGGEILASGTLRIDRDPIEVGLALEWRGVTTPALPLLRRLRTDGSIAVQATGTAFDVRGGATVEARQGDDGLMRARVDVALEGSPEALRIRSLRIEEAGGATSAGTLLVTGRVALAPQIAWDLDAVAERFDPGAVLAGWHGSVELVLATAGEVSESGPRARLSIERLGGRLLGRPLSGGGSLHITPDHTVTGDIRAASGGDWIEVTGASGEILDARVAFAIESLGAWYPASDAPAPPRSASARRGERGSAEGADAVSRFGGSVNGRFTVQGAWPAVALRGHAEAGALTFGEIGARSVVLDVNLDRTEPLAGELVLASQDLTARGLRLARAEVSVVGALSDHRMSLSAQGERLSAQMAAHGSAVDRTWFVSLDALEMSLPRLRGLSLQAPASLTVHDGGAVTLSSACLARDETSVCLSAERSDTGDLAADFSLVNLPLAAIAPNGSEALRDLRGRVSGDGTLRLSAAGDVGGRVALRSPIGRARVTPDVAVGLNGGERIELYRDLRVTAELTGDTAVLSVAAALVGDGSLEGQVTARSLGAPESPIAGRMVARIPSVAPLVALAADIGDPAGRLSAKLAISGTLQSPALQAEITAMELAGSLPALGTRLEAGEIRVRPAPNGALDVEGSIRSGAGRIGLSGAWSNDTGLSLALRGAELLAADLPGARVVVTPDLRLTYDTEGLALSGDVHIPSARIDLDLLARNDAASVSPDVVVVDRAPEPIADASANLPLRARVAVSLGDDVELRGDGFEAALSGSVLVTEMPGRATTASGEVIARGVYRAYGQELSIDRGLIRYAGTPLADPRLSVVAVREVSGVTVGLRITGSASSPNLDVFSSPPMPQADALAYLVTGRPLASVGAAVGEEQRDALAAAARSLGAAAGSSIAERIGARLGIDELGIQENELLGGDAFTVGKYLSPRLYVGYGVGLFEPGDMLELRYSLSDVLSLEILRGTEDTRAGVELRLER
jgi:translocation and assembly module TamB